MRRFVMGALCASMLVPTGSGFAHGDHLYMDASGRGGIPPVREVAVESVRLALKQHVEAPRSTRIAYAIQGEFMETAASEAILAGLLEEAWAETPENGLAWKMDAGAHLYHGRLDEALASMERAAADLYWDFEVHYWGSEPRRPLHFMG